MGRVVAKLPDKYNDANQQGTWQGFGRPRVGPSISIGTIYRLAQDYGRADRAQTEYGADAKAESRSVPSDGQESAAGDYTHSTATARFRELAALPRVEYDRVRIKEAEKLGIRVGTLDDEVDRHRDKSDDEFRAGGPLDLPSPEPWPSSVDGAVLLDEIAREILRFVMISREFSGGACSIHFARTCICGLINQSPLDCRIAGKAMRKNNVVAHHSLHGPPPTLGGQHHLSCGLPNYRIGAAHPPDR